MRLKSMINKIADRFREIAQGTNTDSSDEYYTLFPAFSNILIEVLCRYQSGKIYKVIICPCDSQTSIFRELIKYKKMIGDPQIIYSQWPDKDWKEYFNMDYEKEYGCKAEEVLILTNPPFKGLSRALPEIQCDYILFGSNAVGISGKIYAKEVKTSLYLKNNTNYSGNADDYKELYGRVCTLFYSNRQFESEGRQYTNKGKSKKSVLFDKDMMTIVK